MRKPLWSPHLNFTTCIEVIVQSLSRVSSLQPHEWQHARPPCLSPTPRACSNSCPSNWWCHPTISSSVVPFSCLQSFSASGSFPMSQLFASGGQSIGVSASASVLPMNIQGWFPLGWTGLIFLMSKGLPTPQTQAPRYLGSRTMLSVKRTLRRTHLDRHFMHITWAPTQLLGSVTMRGGTNLFLGSALMVPSK